MLDTKTRGKKEYERVITNVLSLTQHDVITASGDDQRDVLMAQDKDGGWNFGFRGANE